MQDFRELKVWTKAHQLALELYRVTAGFQTTERYGLSQQVRRAGASIPANIAEGCGRRTRLDFARFLHTAQGSACELEYHLLLARDLHYLDISEHQRLNTTVTEIKRMLFSFIKRLAANPQS